MFEAIECILKYEILLQGLRQTGRLLETVVLLFGMGAAQLRLLKGSSFCFANQCTRVVLGTPTW